MPAAGRKFLALKEPPLSVYNNVSACRRQKIFGFERAPQPLSYIVHNTISACHRHKFFVLFGFEGPFSLSLSSQWYKCLPQANFFVLFGFEGPPLSVYNNVSACRRRKFFGFERAPSASLLHSSQYYKCLLQAEFFDLFGFERAPPPLSVHNNVSVCRMRKFFGFERAPSASLLHSSQYYKCLLQAEFFDLFGFERAPLSVHNNVSACLRQKNFGFERAPSASLLHT